MFSLSMRMDGQLWFRYIRRDNWPGTFIEDSKRCGDDKRRTFRNSQKIEDYGSSFSVQPPFQQNPPRRNGLKSFCLKADLATEVQAQWGGLLLKQKQFEPGPHSAIPAYRQAGPFRIPQLFFLAPHSLRLAPYGILGTPEQFPFLPLFCLQIIYLEISVDSTEFSR